jgi:hypothetical protein
MQKLRNFFFTVGSFLGFRGVWDESGMLGPFGQ